MRKNSSQLSIVDFLGNYRGCISYFGDLKSVNYQHISIDSRTIRNGDLFVAINGENFDGHNFAHEAFRKGASVVVVNKNWWDAKQAEDFACFNGKPVIVVEDTLNFLQELAHWHRLQYSIPVIGITGSNGKTTTKEMVNAVLQERFTVLSTAGNLNNHIGLPLMLLKIEENTDIAVLEMGTNHPGEIARLAEIAKPTAGVITNIGKGHIGFFGSQEDIYQEKKALFDALAAGQPVFINMEDSFLKNYPADGRKAITVGLDESADVWGKIIGKNYLGCYRFLLYGKYPIYLNIPGQHNVMNALLAAAVGLEFGLDEDEIVMGLEEFRASEKRMQIIEKNGVVFVNDAYNANPDSMKAALRYLAELETNGKRIAVLGDMLELGEFAEEEHLTIAKNISELPLDAVFTFGHYSKLITEYLQKNAKNTIIAQWHNSHHTIAEALKKMLSNGDIVLLKGSRSMKMESILSLLEATSTED